ncbi:glycosyltransferase family 2 protein [Labrys sp. LIt4]|uniref:Glycosyl transferase family 2 n=1 Tax=Labrys okinawensis TaxID=346911 RepID=A0A2S9Q843_9HYPH|nr:MULTISPECIES: glycosyltransferase family A protein [Labrys]MBP0581847.1 glycosyltransferase family 2 protein [Labrys sp. LIt4]PRH85515.1 glycosyl transferase family 2 [Labrys okinawensis]
MSQPELSIIIPTKDRPELLQRALASAQAQSFRDFELVVVDDGDGRGARLAEDLGLDHLQALLSGGSGQVPARNLGVAAARGRRIAFLDDDDWWAEPDHLERMLAKSDSRGLLYASGRIVAEGQRADAGSELAFEAHADAEAIRRDNRLLVSGVIYPRSLHQNLGPFDDKLPYYWDWDWYLRLFAAGVPFSGPQGNAVRISARDDSVSAAVNLAARQANLGRLSAKHGLGQLVLRNHESIAREGGRPS